MLMERVQDAVWQAMEEYGNHKTIARAALTAAKQIADELGNEAASVFLGAVLTDTAPPA